MRGITLQSFESVLSSDRAFCGSQLGDFALVGLIGCNAVCVLGAGFGGAMPAIMIANPDARIVGVDSDPHLTVAGEAIQRSYFPAHEFEAVCADALDYLTGSPSESFDALCVDLFTENGYAELYDNDAFWDHAARVLTVDGVVVVNTWGLPSHLDPFDGQTPHVAVARHLAARFGEVRVVNHLRNQTLLAGPGLRPVKLSRPVEWPYRHDRLAAHALAAKYSASRCLTIDDLPVYAPSGDSSFDTATLAALYEQRLTSFADGLQIRIGIGATRDELPRAYLRRALASPDAPQWLDSLLASSDQESAAFVASYFCSQSAGGDTGTAWFPEWLIDNYDRLARQHTDWLARYGLWHVAAVSSNPMTVVENDWVDRLMDVVAATALPGSVW